MPTLAVHPVPPGVRHETTFEQLDSLRSATFRLVDDHDPVSLRHRLEVTRPLHLRRD